jgi:streptomycin 6-kinase
MTNSNLEPYLMRWRLEPDGAAIETPSSWLLPVHRDRCAAMLKVLKPSCDERNAAGLLRYLSGDGAVRLYEADEDALLLERANGSRSLVTMAISGRDAQAAEILAETVAKLHARRNCRLLPELTPLKQQFSPLYAHAGMMPLLSRCAAVARGLLATERELVPLHGDLHHENVLDGGQRGWLAIDPKALFGERTYEVANLLCNPSAHADIVHQPGRMRWLAELYAARLRLDLQRVLAFALAHAGLSASWDVDDGIDPTYRLGCAEVLNKLVNRRAVGRVGR